MRNAYRGKEGKETTFLTKVTIHSEQNTWEPVENMETCKHLLEAFEKQLARQKELKALKAQQQQAQVSCLRCFSGF